MVRVKGKRLKKKGKTKSKSNAKNIVKKMKKIWKVMSINASISAPAPVSKPVQSSAFAPATDVTGASTHDKEKGRNNSNSIPGFIFLCNGKTKPQCFQYRVFGLPVGQKKTVKKIKPGTKLFLFDYEMRLLYGVFEATSEGKVNLEPTAFEGKFSAQVKFRIIKECLPLPERSFESAMKENCQGAKFRPVLSEPQVKTLESLFCSLSSSSSKLVALPLANAAPPQAILPLRMKDQYKNSNRLHSLQIVEPQPLQTAQIMQHQQHTAGALVDHVHPSFHRQSIPNPIDSYNAHSQELYSTGGHTEAVQEPYPWYSSVQEGLPQYHTLGMRSEYHPLPLQSEPLQPGHQPPQQENNVWYHHQLPLFRARETAQTANTSVPTIHNILSTMQPYAPAYGRSELTHSVPGAYLSSTVQPHASAFGWPEQTYLLPTDCYFSSTMQPYAPASGRPQPNYPLPTAPYVSSTMQQYTLASGRPEENYPLPAASYASSTMQPYAPASGRPEPNYPLPTAPYVSSTMQPYTLASGRPEENYPLPTASYASSTMQPYAPASGRPEPNYPLPTAPYVSSTMQPYTLASGRPEENYPLPTASYASSTMQPYAPASGRPEPNYPLPTAPYVLSTMQPYAPSYGRPEPNVSVSSYYSFAGANELSH